MRKVILLITILLPMLIIAWCGKTPEEKTAENLAKWWFWFIQGIVELWEANQNWDISDEEMSKKLLWEYSDFIWDSADGTEDELSDEEKDMLHDMFTDPKKTEEIVDEALEEDNK